MTGIFARGYYWIGGYPERTEAEELERRRLRDEADERRFEQEREEGGQCS